VVQRLVWRNVVFANAHTTLQTPRKEMANAIILLFPAHAQEKNKFRNQNILLPLPL